MLKSILMILFFCFLLLPAKANPTQFNDDRYSSVGQVAYVSDVVKYKKKKYKKYYQQTRTAGKPAHCPARRWCGCYLASYLGKSDRSLWLARNWARVGNNAGGPAAGTVVVWRHHVGLIKAVEGNRALVLSGNDGRAVRERWRSIAGAIAFRRI